MQRPEGENAGDVALARRCEGSERPDRGRVLAFVDQAVRRVAVPGVGAVERGDELGGRRLAQPRRRRVRNPGGAIR